MVKKKERRNKMLKTKKTYLIPIVGFALIILIGSVLLYLPVCNNEPISFRDAVFTATCSFTTTGFCKVPIINQFNILGQLILAILMEIGALGFVIFISYFWSIRNKKIKMSDILLINDNISTDNYSYIKEHSIFIMRFLLKVQVIGTILLSFRFIPIIGFFKGIWYSIFHAISAFSNTGFDLLGNEGMYAFKDDIYIQIVLIGLMLFGSIGVFTIEDIKNNKSKKFSRLRLQTKIILIYTAILVFLPTIIFKILEPNISVINCMFMSVTSRSTGFSIIDLNEVSTLSKIILIILMFIGGAPASTAGGVRILPIAIILATAFSTLRGKSKTVMFWRTIPEDTIRKAFTILVLFLIILSVNTILFSIFENFDLTDIVFECVSALSNTGLTIIDVNSFNLVQELAILLQMFIGRAGILSLVLIFVIEDKKENYIEYPKENVIL